MKLTKTKELLDEAIKRNREDQTGRPFTDYEILQVIKEIRKFETKLAVKTYIVYCMIAYSFGSMFYELLS